MRSSDSRCSSLARCVDPPTAAELRRSLLASGPARRRAGRPAAGGGRHGRPASDTGFVRFLAVDPTIVARASGRALLAAAEADLRAAGARTITVGADAPVLPLAGVDTPGAGDDLPARAARSYSRVETNFNMDVDLAASPPTPAVGASPTPRATVTRSTVGATALGVVARRDGARASTRADSCSREDDRRHRGSLRPRREPGRARRPGRGAPGPHGPRRRRRAAASARSTACGPPAATRAEVAWVGPVVPYARVGATIGRVFLVYRKDLAMNLLPMPREHVAGRARRSRATEPRDRDRTPGLPPEGYALAIATDGVVASTPPTPPARSTAR